MAVLSDKDIKKAIKSGKIQIKDFVDENISCASIDLRLGNEFRVFKHTELTHIDVKNCNHADLMELVTLNSDKPFIIHPGQLVLGITMEYVKMPADLIARLDGRSSLGRLGIVIHSTAGTVDPGFEGRLTLEISNISNVPVCLWSGIRVCRLTFEEMSSESEQPYNTRKGSKYLKQQGPEASRIFGER